MKYSPVWQRFSDHVYFNNLSYLYLLIFKHLHVYIFDLMVEINNDI